MWVDSIVFWKGMLCTTLIPYERFDCQMQWRFCWNWSIPETIMFHQQHSNISPSYLLGNCSHFPIFSKLFILIGSSNNSQEGGFCFFFVLCTVSVQIAFGLSLRWMYCKEKIRFYIWSTRDLSDFKKRYEKATTLQALQQKYKQVKYGNIDEHKSGPVFSLVTFSLGSTTQAIADVLFIKKKGDILKRSTTSSIIWNKKLNQWVYETADQNPLNIFIYWKTGGFLFCTLCKCKLNNSNIKGCAQGFMQ